MANKLRLTSTKIVAVVVVEVEVVAAEVVVLVDLAGSPLQLFELQRCKALPLAFRICLVSRRLPLLAVTWMATAGESAPRYGDRLNESLGEKQLWGLFRLPPPPPPLLLW